MPFTIPDSELSFRASRAGGPGGQHVNRAATRVEVRWNVVMSPSLSAAQRELLLRKLASRIDSDGDLRVVADERRSQLQNRQAAVERLNVMVQQALEEPPPRKKTKPPPAAKEARLQEKRRRSRIKLERRRPDLGD